MGTFPQAEDIDALLLFSQQLTSLKFRLVAVDPDVDERLSYHNVLLKRFLSNFNFKHLKIRCRGPPLIISQDVFQKLISFGLKNLSLSTSSVSVENPESFVPHLLAQNTPSALPNLSLYLCRTETKSFDFFLQNFRNLHSLRLFGTSQNIFESLFKYQLKLKSLTLGGGVDELTKCVQDRLDTFRGAFNQLTDIEHLVVFAPFGDIFVRCLSPTPILAKLKYLHLHITNESQKIVKVGDAAPSIEGLRIVYQHCIESELCFQLLRKLNRLRYFEYIGGCLMVEDRLWADENYRELFLICPSLRVLVHRNSRVRIDRTYFFDTINREVLVKRTPYQIFFHKPRVGGQSVNWLVLL